MKSLFKAAVPLLLLIMLFIGRNAFAQSEEEMQILRLFYKEEDLVVSATRSPKPLDQVAENIIVITSKDMEEMNAHTLVDVLYTVPGVQMDIKGGPGIGSTAHIQGSESRHVLVTIDGVELNNLSDTFADMSSIPVQNIERVEVVKGPASSSWGSSLGGVINIITKPAGDSRTFGGMLYGSYGERNTRDYRAEVSGKVRDLGYYLSAGNFATDGLRPNTHVHQNNLYSKLRWDLSDKALLQWTFGYSKGSKGAGEAPSFDLAFDTRTEYLFSTLSLNYKITEDADLDLSLRTVRRHMDQSVEQFSTGTELSRVSSDDDGYGGSLRFVWKKGMHNLVIGSEYDDGDMEANFVTGRKQTLEKWGIYANDTVLLGGFSITPGIRYDHTSTNDDFVSPSLGVTYKLGEKTVLRGYVARGFSIPPLATTFGTGFFSIPNPDLEVEKVWSYQVGAESAALKYLWIKTTLFRHDIEDAIVNSLLAGGQSFKPVNRDKQRRQGVEVEVRTAQLWHTFLSGGFAFIDAKDRRTDETLKDVARYTYDVGIHYNNDKLFWAMLKGHYIWWNNGPGSNGKYTAMIWDLNVGKNIYGKDDRNVELFLTAHNLFNGSQYALEFFKDARRWVEGGIRVTF